MKKLICLIVFGLSIYTSCKKSGSSDYNTGTISATVDGKTVVFNFNALAMRTADDTLGVYSLSIGGYEGVPGTGAALSLYINGTHPIGPGTYISDRITNYVTMNYLPQTDSIQFSNAFDTINPCTVAIKFITPNDIEGTFSGKLKLIYGTYPETTKTVTNGQFSVKIR
jgi:hypothetical protein